jgi:rhamnosyltransferase
VIESGSSDDTVTIVEKYGAKIVKITPDEFTFGRSLNWGGAAALGALVLNVSAHGYPVYPDWLEKMLRRSKMLRSRLAIENNAGEQPIIILSTNFFKNSSLTFRNLSKDSPIRIVNVAIRRSLWER